MHVIQVIKSVTLYFLFGIMKVFWIFSVTMHNRDNLYYKVK